MENNESNRWFYDNTNENGEVTSHKRLAQTSEQDCWMNRYNVNPHIMFRRKMYKHDLSDHAMLFVNKIENNSHLIE